MPLKNVCQKIHGLTKFCIPCSELSMGNGTAWSAVIEDLSEDKNLVYFLVNIRVFESSGCLQNSSYVLHEILFSKKELVTNSENGFQKTKGFLTLG